MTENDARPNYYSINPHLFAMTKELKVMLIVLGIALLNILAQPDITIAYVAFFTVASIVLCVVVGFITYRFYIGLAKTYEVIIDDFKIAVRYGRITTHSIVIQRVKLKHYTTRATVIERKLNASTLELFSSGSKHPDMTIPCLPNTTLHQIISHVLPDIDYDPETHHQIQPIS